MNIKDLKRLPTRYDASKIFKKGKKVYFYFVASDVSESDFKYYLFDKSKSFTQNFELCLSKFINVKGFWQLTTDGSYYQEQLPISVIYKQLSLF